jgi:hypothetical protein
MAADELKQAASLIRAGRGGEARPILARFLQANPASEDGWLLLSMVLRDRQQRIDCLQRALRLNPANGVALERLAELQARAAEAKPESPAKAEAPAPPTSAFTFEPTQAKAPVPADEDGDLPAWATGALPPWPSAAAPAATPAIPAKDRYAEPPAQARPPATPRAAAASAKPAARRSVSPVLIGLLALVGIVAVGVLGFVGVSLMAAMTPPAAPLTTAGPVQVLPPSWTPTLTPTDTPVPTLTPTPTLTPLPSPEPTMAAVMQRIQIEVSDIRGLESKGHVTDYVVARPAVRPILEENFLANGGSREQMEDESRVLSALGLVKPTYDMYTNALNGLTDSLGGFYFPWSKELYVIGGRFGGVEHFIYSHEYAHALVDQHFDIGGAGVYPECLSNADRCQAIQALVEGDATLVMGLWLRQYAGPKDYQDISNYVAPQSTLPEQYPPPFAILDGQFAYLAGLEFVQALHDRGNWPEVNKAYTRWPESTEQIMHPEKYRAAEAPQVLPAPSLEGVLGGGWRKLAEDTLGEWTTYLLLGYGADQDAMLEDDIALAAARGWGGDRYQMYYHDGTTQSVLAAVWGWDSARDATGFHAAMTNHLAARFRDADIAAATGACWEINQQTSCLYLAGTRVLWILAPDVDTVGAIRDLYPGF